MEKYTIITIITIIVPVLYIWIREIFIDPTKITLRKRRFWLGISTTKIAIYMVFSVSSFALGVSGHWAIMLVPIWIIGIFLNVSSLNHEMSIIGVIGYYWDRQ